MDKDRKSFVSEILKLPAFQEVDTTPLSPEEEAEIKEEIEKIDPRKLLGEYILNLPAFRELEDAEEPKK